MRLESSNKKLEEFFNWAQLKAKEFVMTDKCGEINKGDNGYYYGPAYPFTNKNRKTRKNNMPWSQNKEYAPSFIAGYKSRSAYYSRDFLHMCSGAHYLGYDKENYSMMSSFIEKGINRKEMFCPWSLNFDTSIYYLDHKNDNYFAQEYPVQFEFVEMLYKLYLLTNNENYVRNDNHLTFCKYVLTEFIDANDSGGNGIPESRGNMWVGSSTYNESSSKFIETADCIATIYRARLAYCEILKINGFLKEATIQFKKAQTLKDYYQNVWSKHNGNHNYVYAIDKKGIKYSQWYKKKSKLFGGETLFFIANKSLVDANERTDSFLDYLFENVTNPLTRMDNIEYFTYLPKAFCNYDKSDYAWEIIKYIGNTRYQTYAIMKDYKNEDYPELAFTMISNIIEGIIGVNYNDLGELIVKPCLPNEIKDLALYDMPYKNELADIFIKDKKVNINIHQK